MPMVVQSPPDLIAIARQVRLSPRVVNYCLEVGLIQEPISDSDLAEFRRVRRLQSLGVNLAGVEIILRMRRRLLAMQAEIEATAAEMSAMQDRFESELRDIEQRLAHEL